MLENQREAARQDAEYLRGLFRFGSWESPHSWDSEEALGPTDWALEEAEMAANVPNTAVPKQPAPVLDPLARITVSMEQVATSMQGLTLEMGQTQAEVRAIAQRQNQLIAQVARHEESIAAKGIMIQSSNAPSIGKPSEWQYSGSSHSGSATVTGQQVEEMVTHALQTKVAPVISFMMQKTEARFEAHATQLQDHASQLRAINLRVAWAEKESYYAQIEVAKRQVAIRGVPEDMSDRHLMLTVEQGCLAAKVDPRMVDLSIPKTIDENNQAKRGPVQFVSFLTASARRDFMQYNKENEKEGTKLQPWTWAKEQKSREEEVTDDENPSQKKTQTITWTENIPQPNKSLRAKIKCTPGITQFERRLSAPMHGLMHAYKDTFPRYKTETLVPKWKTLILTDQRGAWLGQLEYTRTAKAFSTTGGSTADWKCDIQLPQEHFEKLMASWKTYWYTQLRSQVQYTDAESQAIKNLAEDTADDYRTANRISKLVQRQIPQWNESTEQGIKDWIVRFK